MARNCSVVVLCLAALPAAAADVSFVGAIGDLANRLYRQHAS